MNKNSHKKAKKHHGAILTQCVLEESSLMCNVSGLITGIYKGLYLAGSTGRVPCIYQTCSTHLRSDLQSRLSISSQPYSCTPLQSQLRNFHVEASLLGVFGGSFLWVPLLRCLYRRGYTGRCFSSSLVTRFSLHYDCFLPHLPTFIQTHKTAEALCLGLHLL